MNGREGVKKERSEVEVEVQKWQWQWPVTCLHIGQSRIFQVALAIADGNHARKEQVRFGQVRYCIIHTT